MISLVICFHFYPIYIQACMLGCYLLLRLAAHHAKVRGAEYSICYEILKPHRCSSRSTKKANQTKL